MARRGPKPKSDFERARSGTAASRRIAGVIGLIPDPPEGWLSEAERKVWDEVVPRVAELGILRESDVFGLALLSGSIARFRAAHEMVDREGILVAGHRGVMRKHPALRIVDMESRTMLTLMKDYGMTPASRASLDIQPPPQRDSLGEFLGRGPNRDKWDGLLIPPKPDPWEEVLEGQEAD